MRNKSSGAGMLALAFLLLIPILIIWDGFIISMIWNWFMPKIFGLVSLSIPQALGLSLMASVLVGRGRDSRSEDEDPMVTILKPFLIGLIALVMGAIVQMFI